MPAVVPSLYERAEGWHRRHLARCACVAAGVYPCAECQREIGDLLDLLDAIARDAILATSAAYARLAAS